MSDLKISNDKHVFNVIKCSAPQGVLLWREPIEQFNNGSTLIINPSECALFLSEGKIVGKFFTGSHKLETKNIPFLTGIKSTLLSGGVSRYTAQIYFVRMSETPEIKFGTSSPIMVRDNRWGIAVPVRLYGVFKVKIIDPQQFFERVNFGDTSAITDQTLKSYINDSMQQTIRSSVTSYFKSYSDELIGIEDRTSEISEKLEEELSSLFQGFGMELTLLRILSVNFDMEKYNQIDQAKIQGISRKIDAEISKQIFDILGDDWQRQKEVEILERSASNSQSGGVLSAIYLSDKIKGDQNSSEDGSQVSAKLQNLKDLLDQGLITVEEYKERRKAILDKYL